MKCLLLAPRRGACPVAPCAGAWIEIIAQKRGTTGATVAPCAGAWIEIYAVGGAVGQRRRRPLRGGVD